MTNDEYEFRNIFSQIAINGKKYSPRGLKILELENFSYELSPYVRFFNFKSRKLNLDYIKKEFQWYLKGDKFDTSIADDAIMWKNLINESGEIYSNYGQYIFGEQNQFDRVVNILKEDKESRRACIVILSNIHLSSKTNDYPCTYSINFHIRDNKLNMIVRMRSQDMIFGMGNDAPCFSFVHEMMFETLKAHYKELEYGTYFHSADSFHVYERHFGMLDKLCNLEEEFEVISCPKMSGIEEVNFLRKCDYSNIPDNFKFTKWLNTYERIKNTSRTT